MVGAALIGGVATFSWSAFALFLAATAFALLFGHPPGNHRELIAVPANVRTRRAPMALQGRFATLPEPALRTLLGARTSLAHDLDVTRMQMQHDVTTIIGLPALMLTLASRNLPSFILAMALLSATMLAEVLRERLS